MTQSHVHASDLNDVLLKAAKSSATFGMLFYPEVFTAGITEQHAKILNLLDSDVQKAVIAAPRGFGKTSSMIYAYIPRLIMFRYIHFVVYISNTLTIAELQTENLKRGLFSNKALKAVFPSMRETSVKDVNESFSKLAWVVNDETFVLPRGMEQQVRSLLWKNHRPDLIVFDDVEPSELESDTKREKQRMWFYSDPMKCISQYAEKLDIKYRYIDTMKHEDGMLAHLMKQTAEWVSLRIEACDDNLVPTCPAYMNQEKVWREYNLHKEAGLLDVFFREFRNMPVSTADAVFQTENFKYFVFDRDNTVTADNQSYRLTDMLRVLLCDPAKTTKQHSAESALVVAGIHKRTHQIFLLDIVSDRLHPDELYANIANLIKLFKVDVLGVEVTSLHDFIIQPLKAYLAEHQIFVYLKELKAVGHKVDRIKHLAPYYRRGMIYHKQGDSHKIESQLTMFPKMALCDIIDALAYVPKLLEDLSFRASFLDVDSFQNDPEGEYKDLHPLPDLFFKPYSGYGTEYIIQ